MIATLVSISPLTNFTSTDAARAAIEDEYARKLLALCRKPLGSCEAGTLRASLDTVRGEVESMGKAHQSIAGQIKSELEEPLAAQAGGMKERRKIVQSGIEKILKVKIQQTNAVNKVCFYAILSSLHAKILSSQGTDMSKIASVSRATWLKATWSWDKKSERIGQSLRRHRSTWLLLILNMRTR